MSQTTNFRLFQAKPQSSVGSIVDLRTGGRWFDPPARPIFFPKIENSHCTRIHSSLTAVRCFDSGYVGKQPVAWEEYSAVHWIKEFQKGTDRCTSCPDIIEILLKTASNTTQSINRRLFQIRYF